MKNHHKIFGFVILFLSIYLIIPTTIAFTESRTLNSGTSSFTRTIFPEDHRGTILFSFTANDSLTAQITDASELVTLWTKTGTNGSCALSVDAGVLYRAKFTKTPGYAVYIQYTVVEQGGIPGFTLLLSIFILLTILGLVYLKQQKYKLNP